MNNRTLNEIYNDIQTYFENNLDVFNEMITSLDSYNGYLGDDRYYSMCDIDEILCVRNVSDALYMAFYGYDEDDWYISESGNRIHGAFNPNRDYFRFNGYGNLVSTNYPDYTNHLDEYAILAMADNDIYEECDDEILTQLFKELLEVSEGE